jgi:hypothetical protein
MASTEVPEQAPEQVSEQAAPEQVAPEQSLLGTLSEGQVPKTNQGVPEQTTATTSDEDMASMHMTMLGESYEGQRDQQGHPNQEGGPKLIRFESPRSRPKSSSSPSRAPGAVCSKTDAQVAYGLRF